MPDSPTEAPPRAARWRRRALFVAAGACGAVVLVAVGYAVVARGHPELAAWHRVAPEGEPTAAEIDAGMDLAGYRAREDAVLRDARERVAAELDGTGGGHGRFAPDSPINPARFAVDWNRTFERIPGRPVGRVLLLHGMTDGPYSARALADRLHAQGFHVLAPRLQGHGTTPAGLLDARWEDWAATTRLAMRHLRDAGDPALPLVVVGYSTGAALALQHQLAALDDPALPRADRLVLLSPLVGLSRGAGLAPLLSALDGLPGFEKAAWLDVMPEYNPFKYNSFPVNGGWQSHRLASEVVAALDRARAEGSLARLPPILTFHSVLDTTVRSDAVVRRLYDALPANGSELVMYDLNRWNVFLPLFRPAQLDGVRALFDGGPRAYTLRVVTNQHPGTRAVHEVAIAPGAREPAHRDLGAAFPPEVFSLSHTAVPFPCDDPLYGIAPRTDEDFGVRLGTLALRGERHALQVPMEQLARLNCNPFFDDLAAQVLAWAAAGGAAPR
ncbi:MAG: alpha/beta hydrolase [Xanthomonadaceae bacterium]|jgi:alpha-beta hydrolase superfamily lysophospholipase|nr:alpha/beta hydrolase [Xanthomonadaceae bacterium]